MHYFYAGTSLSQCNKIHDRGQPVGSSKTNDVMLNDSGTPLKARRGIPAWYTGQISASCANHIFWPSPPKKKNSNIKRRLFPSCASAKEWRDLYREGSSQNSSQKTTVKSTKFYKKDKSGVANVSANVPITSIRNTATDGVDSAATTVEENTQKTNEKKKRVGRRRKQTTVATGVENTAITEILTTMGSDVGNTSTLTLASSPRVTDVKSTAAVVS